MCRWAEVSRSGFYDWRNRKPSATARWREILEAEIRFCFDHSDSTYGYRRVHAQLARWGIRGDPDTVRKIIRELGVIPLQQRPFRAVSTTAVDAARLSHQV